MRDVMAALLTMAMATPQIAALVQTRIYVNEIPRKIVEGLPPLDPTDTRQPPKMLVLRQAGGGSKADILPLTDTTIVALCYGETDHEADRVIRAVAQRFTLLSREQHADVLIHHLNPTGGPIPSVEPDLVWPAVAQSYTVKADVLEVR